MSWNEASSRAATFLSALSAAVVALALVAQATSFGEGFVTVALLILPVVLFLGVTTFVRLVEINKEDVRWVIGMNLLRHAYLEAAPELRPYFITGWHDDEDGIMATFGARAGLGGFTHEFVTAPGVLAVVNGALAGVLTGVVGPRLGAGTSLTLGLAVAIGLLTIALLAVYQYQGRSRRSSGLLIATPIGRAETRALFVEYDRAAELDALSPTVRAAVLAAFDAALARLPDDAFPWDAPLVAARAVRPPDD